MWLGCPVKQEIVDSSTAIAYGDGLAKAVEGQEAMFYVDARGQPGDLAVQVDGSSTPTVKVKALFIWLMFYLLYKFIVKACYPGQSQLFIFCCFSCF